MPSRAKRTASRNTVWIGLGGLLLGALAGVLVLGGHGEARPSRGGFPKDVNGDGIVSDHGEERIPELIRAVGDNGVSGYIRYEDYSGSQPTNPEEALRMPKDEVISVYAADGVTVVDHLTLSATSATEAPGSPSSSP
jgi:hypothetical protein